MKKILILLILLLLSFSTNVLAQKAMTAKQLFMLLPDEYVSGTAKERATYLVFPKSIKADFLSFMITDKAVPQTIAGDFREPQGIGDLRVYRGKSSTIVGLRYQVGDGKEANPTADTTKIVTVLLEMKGGKWTNVTDSLLPKVSVDEAHKIVTEFPETKDVKKENVWVEMQVSKDKNGLLSVARVKGNESVTVLKWFKWNGTSFVETEYK